MQDQPTPIEILRAVKQFLQDEVAPQLDATRHYRLKVATNAISLIERQLAEPPVAAQEEQARLEALTGEIDVSHEAPPSLYDLNNKLCALIRHRHIAFDDIKLRTHLLATTFAKLDVDQPHYGGLVRTRILLGHRAQK